MAHTAGPDPRPDPRPALPSTLREVYVDWGVVQVRVCSVRMMTLIIEM